MKVAVITGAASGMGRACAERFAAEGWAVAGLDRDADGLQVVRQRLGRRAIAAPADVSDAKAVECALQKVVRSVGVPSACINAAGIFRPTTLETADRPVFDRIFRGNVLGIVLVTEYLARHMGRNGGGFIINFASVDAFVTSPGQLLYCASKAGVVSVTRSLALELAPRNVRVNAVAPGWVDTEGNRARAGCRESPPRFRSEGWPHRRRLPISCGFSPATAGPATSPARRSSSVAAR